MAFDHETNDQERKNRAALAAYEEEAWHADEEYRQQLDEEEEAENRSSAIESMYAWFHEQFEDPQNETPRSEGEYIYIFGGPFDAGDVLRDYFSSEYKNEWIDAAVDRVQAGGTFEWAPSPYGDYYEHPEEDDDLSSVQRSPVPTELRSQILDRLEAIEQKLASLSDGPPPIGHNHPPGETDNQPYATDGEIELKKAITVAREEVKSDHPDRETIKNSESFFRRIGTDVLNWARKKFDLAADEAIKSGVKVIVWTEVGKEFLSLASDLLKLLQHLQ